jgi:glycosyltransferase involved in cell wall biosynthesis
MPDLVLGGAQRALLNIVENLDRKRFTPRIILFEGIIQSERPRTPVDVLPWFPTPARFAVRTLALARLLRRRKIELLVSFMPGPNLMALLAAALVGCKVVASERAVPSVNFSDANPRLGLRAFWRWFARHGYPRADAILVNAGRIKEELVHQYRIPSRKVTVIPNIVDIVRIKRLASASAPGTGKDAIVSIGRLTWQKNFPLLLRAFARLPKPRPALLIVGGGEDEQKLRALARELGIDDEVTFLGPKKNPYPYLKRARVFVLSSHYEGLPNVVLEALALGIPVISTDCPSGPRELLQDGMYGLLVPPDDSEALAAALKRLLRDRKTRARFGRLGPMRARQFDSRLIKRYARFFQSVARGAPSHSGE